MRNDRLDHLMLMMSQKDLLEKNDLIQLVKSGKVEKPCSIEV